MDKQTINNAKMLGSCVLDMIHYCGQLKVIHFLALKNHNHAEIDNGRIELADELDEFVEALLGKFTGKLKPEEILLANKPKSQTFKLVKTPKQILSYLEMMEQRVQKGLSIVDSDPELKFLLDSLMDMAAIINSMRYLINQE